MNSSKVPTPGGRRRWTVAVLSSPAVNSDERVSFGPRGLRIAGRDVPLLSGAMHYFRTPPRHWGRCLQAIRGLGFVAVETYVPWGIHEVRAGQFDFTLQRDLGAFLDAAAGEGLLALLRPGPHINAELTWFGFPERIVSDPRMLARTARGTPAALMIPPRGFPVPSYASSAFLDEVRGWYAAVAEVVAPRLHPRGPVVAIQVDNEHAHFFRSGAYDGDYHDEALLAWRACSGGAEPPRRFAARTPSDLAPHLAWLAFRERQTTSALAALAKILDEVGLGGVPRYHNFPPTEANVFDLPAAETAVDVAGVDLYHPRRHYDRIRRRALHLAGSSRLPYVPEMGMGSFPWGPPFSDEDSIAQLQNALGHGVAGYNAYMVVERDRWYGCPVGPDGTVRPGLADVLRRINSALGEIGWTSLERRAEIGLVIPRSYLRLGVAASHVGPLGPAFGEFFGLDEQAMARESTFGLDGPVQLELPRWRDAIIGALSRAHLPFVIVDGGAPLELLAKRKALVVPTFDFLEADLAARLRAFAEGGGKLLSGPRRPHRDAAMQENAAELPGELLPHEALEDPAALAAALEALARTSGARRAAPAREPDVDTALHVHPDGSPALLLVATRANRPLTAAVLLDSAATVEDLRDGTTFSGASLEIPLAPFGVRLLRFR